MSGIRMTRAEYFAAFESGQFGNRRAEWVQGIVTIPDRVPWPHVVACRNVGDELQNGFQVAVWLNFANPFITPDAVVFPDVVVVPGRFEDYTDHPTSPLLTVEVAGTTLDRDTTVKAEIYATAGVTDYWVLDLDGRRLLVFRDPQPIPDGGSAYRSLTELGESDTVSPLAAPAAQLRVADLLP